MNDYAVKLIVRFLRNIPQSNQQMASLADILGTNATPEAAGILMGCAKMLEMMGVVQFEPASPTGQSRLRATSQTAKYTLTSLASYMEAGVPLVEDWKQRGALVEDASVLESGAKLLYMMEQRRKNVLDTPPPSRYVKVAQALIKRNSPKTGTPELLMQFDPEANRYQLIGGRWHELDGEDMEATMNREIVEELAASNLKPGRDYRLQIIAENLSLGPILSPTFGALTCYHFWIYHVVGLKRDLVLQPFDRWVPVEQILTGHIFNTEDTKNLFHRLPHYRQIDAIIPGGLMGLGLSTE